MFLVINIVKMIDYVKKDDRKQTEFVFTTFVIIYQRNKTLFELALQVSSK